NGKTRSAKTDLHLKSNGCAAPGFSLLEYCVRQVRHFFLSTKGHDPMLFSPCCAPFAAEKRRPGARSQQVTLAGLLLSLLISGCASVAPSSVPPSQSAAPVPPAQHASAAVSTTVYPTLQQASAAEQLPNTKLVDLTVAPNDVWSRIR